MGGDCDRKAKASSVNAAATKRHKVAIKAMQQRQVQSELRSGSSSGSVIRHQRQITGAKVGAEQNLVRLVGCLLPVDQSRN